MDAGLYIAAQGMLAEQVRQTQLSNDLSNASTPGYKPDQAQQQSFDCAAAAEHVHRPADRLDRDRGDDQQGRDRHHARRRCTPPGSRWTSVSPARDISRSRPPRASATPATASSAPTRPDSSSTPVATRCCPRAALRSPSAPRARSPPPRSASSTSPAPPSRATTSSPARPPARAAGVVQSRRARGLRRRPDPDDDRHDRLAARLSVGPERDPVDRPDDAGRRVQRRLPRR